MAKEDTLDYTHFPELIEAMIRLSGEFTPTKQVLDADGLITRPFLPLRGLVLFPDMVAPIFIGRERSVAALQAAGQHGEALIVAAQRDTEAGDPTADDIFRVGLEVNIGRTLRLPDNNNSVLCQGVQRVEIVEFVQWDPYIRVRARPIPEPDNWDSETEALMRAVLHQFENIVDLNNRLPEDAYTLALNAESPGWLADFITQTLDFPLLLKQELLETYDANQRLHRLSVILAHELDLLEAEDRIHLRVQEEIDHSQREHFLRQQMRAIQGELGENDAFTQEINDLLATIAAKEMPQDVRVKLDRELARLTNTPPMSPETGVIRSYIDWLVALPWLDLTDDSLDVKEVARVLDEDHHGLEKVKERILEHIAVRKIAPDKMRTPILCLVGPPGTGKTSIGRSIARALNRNFVRLSLGGVHDEAEIRGHRRTYVGAMPGRIIQAIRRAGSNNPVFILDEIDKVGQDFRGDPAAALLEVLDPEQNRAFQDHYLEMDYDLSKVFFITTANILDTIPEPLLDRMELIPFSSYLDEEKLEICRQFLIPRQLEQHGLSHAGLHFNTDALKMLIRRYTYEPGVRNLEREIANVCRKVARRVAENQRYPRRVTPERLQQWLGPPPFPEEWLREEDEIGVVTGLAWTATGGDILPIEVNLMSGKGELTLTGQLGEVMQESAQAALSYTRSQAEALGVDDEIFEKTDIHLHVPEGAVPKDGPSAGIAMATALISAFTDRPIRRDVSMTGEVTLRGRVLPVGGVREKVLAARRVGIHTVILPRKNGPDLEKIPRKLRQELTLILVDHMHEVLEVALLPAEHDKDADDHQQPA